MKYVKFTPKQKTEVCQLNSYIFNNVKTRVYSKDTIEAHEAVFSLKAKESYMIFKKPAEVFLKREWSCPAVQKLMR